MVENLEKSLFDCEPEKMSLGIGELQRNINFFEKNYAHLRQLYGEEWVAIFNQRVILHDRSYVRVLKSLRGLGINTESAYRQFLETKSRTQMLQEAVLSLPVGI